MSATTARAGDEVRLMMGFCVYVVRRGFEPGCTRTLRDLALHLAYDPIDALATLGREFEAYMANESMRRSVATHVVERFGEGVMVDDACPWLASACALRCIADTHLLDAQVAAYVLGSRYLAASARAKETADWRMIATSQVPESAHASCLHQRAKYRYGYAEVAAWVRKRAVEKMFDGAPDPHNLLYFAVDAETVCAMADEYIAQTEHRMRETEGVDVFPASRDACFIALVIPNAIEDQLARCGSPVCARANRIVWRKDVCDIVIKTGWLHPHAMTEFRATCICPPVIHVAATDDDDEGDDDDSAVGFMCVPQTPPMSQR